MMMMTNDCEACRHYVKHYHHNPTHHLPLPVNEMQGADEVQALYLDEGGES